MLPASIPRLDLGVVPSPVEDSPALARAFGVQTLIVKRDDLSGPDFGGNKRRALEYLLAGEATIPVSMGGYGSTWCAALATLAARVGRPAHFALFPQPWSPTVAGLLSTTLQHGSAQLAESRWRMPGAIWKAVTAAGKQGKARWISGGGSNPIGVLGSVNAALEFASQIDQQGLDRPEALLVPLGSGGTAAGLLIGLRLTGWKTEILAVRVADAFVANRWQVNRLVRSTERILRRHRFTVPKGNASLAVIGDQFGSGYGHPTPAARATQTLFAAEHIGLDLTYGAKAASALRAAATRFRHLCFWHTFDARLMSDPLTGHPLFQRAQVRAESLWR